MTFYAFDKYQFLSSFNYHRVYDKSNTLGATCEARNANSSGSHEFTAGF